MFEPNTVFVVGAGASKEVKLPTGAELAEEVSNLLNYADNSAASNKIYMALKWHLKETMGSANTDKSIDVYIKGVSASISEGIRRIKSIDTFLGKDLDNTDVVLFSRVAIAQAILEAERESALWYPSKVSRQPMIHPSETAGTWFELFFNKLVPGRKQQNRKSVFNGITIICFNYDRCIEHYLIHALQQWYGIPSEEAADLVSELKIYHPYGTVGELKTSINSKGFAFGEELEERGLVIAAKNIQTYSTEQIENPKLFSDVKRAIAEAKTIVFLGFAYGEENIKILRPEEPGKVERMFGTTYEMPKHKAGQVKNRMGKLSKERLGHKAYFEDSTCHDLIKSFEWHL